MTRYAEKTTISAAKSRMDIEKILTRYGANGFMYGWADENALVMFQMNERRVKFILPLPDKTDREFTHTPNSGDKRTSAVVESIYEQAVRQRWRALLLVIKAKLEAVESGITEFQEEFLAHIVLPNGQTVGEHMVPQIERAYETGNMPALLSDLRGRADG